MKINTYKTNTPDNKTHSESSCVADLKDLQNSAPIPEMVEVKLTDENDNVVGTRLVNKAYLSGTGQIARYQIHITDLFNEDMSKRSNLKYTLTLLDILTDEVFDTSLTTTKDSAKTILFTGYRSYFDQLPKENYVAILVLREMIDLMDEFNIINQTKESIAKQLISIHQLEDDLTNAIQKVEKGYEILINDGVIGKIESDDPNAYVVNDHIAIKPLVVDKTSTANQPQEQNTESIEQGD